MRCGLRFSGSTRWLGVLERETGAADGGLEAARGVAAGVAPDHGDLAAVRADTTTLLTVRTALTIFTEEDAMVLPPDDKESKPFYVDPPDRPGYTRDLFRSHALLMAKELLDSGHPLTPRLGRLSSEAPIK
jgi:hypothetical protein